MSRLARKIIPVNIEEELKRSYLDYAMSVIIERALPDVRDGLKPVHRRVLFAMHALGNDWNKPYKKSARVVGDVIGKYHPHGDAAVYDTMVRMAQSFSLRYMLIDGQGNFGSVDGDPAAAMRYTEVRMSKISHELLSDLDKETVDYVSNYDGSEKIPDVMPTKIPNLLINGSSGIAVGMATNIPPHNLSEVIDGCLAFIENENISVEELMKYIPGPDFPTAAIITGCPSGIKDAYRTGHGKIYIRAYAEIETHAKTGRETIIVYEIPYQVNKARLMEKFAELVKEKRIEGISGLRDESDKDGMRIVIDIKREASGEIVLNQLYSLTQLQVSFTINMVALDQGKPKLLPLKDILFSFVNHRREVVTRRTIFELKKSRERIHILEALSVALANINRMIKIIRQSSTSTEAKNRLTSHAWSIDDTVPIILKNSTDKHHIILPEERELEEQFSINEGQYYLTDQQAQAILDIRLQKLTSLENKRLIDEYKDLLTYINELMHILQNQKYLTNIIREELISIKNQYNDIRRTKITMNSSSNIKIEDLIHPKDVVVTLSHQGYIKYQPITDYETQRRGGKGKSAVRIKQEDHIDYLLIAHTHDTILMFSNSGKVYQIKVYQLPEASRISKGRPIINFLPLETGERITAIFPFRKYENGRYIFMATASGIVKKTLLTEFMRHPPRSNGIIALNLNEGDKLIGVDLTDGSHEIMLFSSYGKVVRFQENQVRSMGRIATGVKGIHLAQGDKVVSLIVPRRCGNGLILIVTQYGYGKRTMSSEFLTKSRATQGVISIKVNKRNGKVVGAIQANDGDQIMIITDSGMLVRIKVSEVSIVSRNTQGVMLIRTEKKEKVVSLQRIAKPINEE